MTLSMYQVSVPVFVRALNALSAVLDKADGHAAARKIEPGALLAQRLIADMFPLTRQVQIACDFAKGAAARLAGVDVPAWDDKETSIADLKGRIAKTIDFVQGFKAAQIDGSEARIMKNLKIAGQAMDLDGHTYLQHIAMPNFYFHTTMAYAILRAHGVEIGKRDFIGKLPA
jgi:uncharacterized protein